MEMNMIRCEKCGGFFNTNVSQSCPYCSGERTLGELGVTTPVTEAATADVGVTTPIQSAVDDSNITTPVGAFENRTCPVVGWLVALNGSEKGKDYKIYSENNFIGRGENMMISLRGDNNISREKHAIISYDPRANEFYFAPADGRNIVRLNGSAVLMTTKLAPYDRLEIGSTELLFVPLCGEAFQWEG